MVLENSPSPAGQRNPYTALLGSLILLPLLHSLLQDGPLRNLAMTAATLLVFGAAIYSVRGRHGLFRGALILAIPGTIALLAGQLIDETLAEVIRSSTVTVFFVFVAVLILRDVLQAQRITNREVQGALCVYLLAGLAWANLYLIAFMLVPDAFSIPGQVTQIADAPPMVYFSFVTMTTLGYGDVVPVHEIARTLCWIQAVFGQLYIAVLVARFVAMQIAHSSRD